MKPLTRLYGDTPLHALLHVGCFALAGWAILQLTDVRPHLYLIAWFVGAVVIHDFVLLPAYALLDRGGAVALGRKVNYVRFPLLLSGLLALVYFPVMLGKGEDNYRRVAGLGWEGYALRWLGVTLGLLVVSAVVYLVRSRGRSSGGSSS